MNGLVTFLWFAVVTAYCLVPGNGLGSDGVGYGLIGLAFLAIASAFIWRPFFLQFRRILVVSIVFIIVFLPLIAALGKSKNVPIELFWQSPLIVLQMLVAVLSFVVLWRGTEEMEFGKATSRSCLFLNSHNEFLSTYQVLILANILFLTTNLTACILFHLSQIGLTKVILGNYIIYYLTTFVFCWVLAISLSFYIQTNRDMKSFLELSEIYLKTKSENLNKIDEIILMEDRISQRFRGKARTRSVDLALSSITLRREATSSEAVFGVASRSTWSDNATIIQRDFGQVLIGVVPMLGFLGTVIGLADAINGFHSGLSNHSVDITKSIETLSSNILNSLGGLSYAFETTIVGLMYTVILTIISGYVSKRQDSLNGDVFLLCEKLSWTHVV